MLLYHFTCVEHLAAILRDGLSRGEVPFSPTLVGNAVNLTSDSLPEGNGVFQGGLLTEQEGAKVTELNGVEWIAALHEGQKPGGWWLYLGTIPPSSFTEVCGRQGNGYRRIGR